MPQLGPCPRCGGTSLTRQRVVEEEIEVTTEGILVDVLDQEHHSTVELLCLGCGQIFDPLESATSSRADSSAGMK